MELRDPSSEIEKLKFLLGSWRAEDKYESTPIIPGGGSGSGIYKTIFGPGNFSLLTDYSYEGPHGTTSGHQVLTWDAQKEQYAGFVVSSRSPGYILFAAAGRDRTWSCLANSKPTECMCDSGKFFAMSPRQP